MKIVIDTDGYVAERGQAAEIILPNGKLFYDRPNSPSVAIATQRGLEHRMVHYFGACTYATINKLAHQGFPIQIGDVSVAEFLDMIATEEECMKFYN